MSTHIWSDIERRNIGHIDWVLKISIEGEVQAQLQGKCYRPRCVLLHLYYLI